MNLIRDDAIVYESIFKKKRKIILNPQWYVLLMEVNLLSFDEV